MQPIKIISFLCAIGFTLSVLAQSNQSNQPPKDLQPLPELPDLTHEEPDLPDLGGDPALGPK